MSFADPSKQEAARKSLEYMGLTPGMRMSDVQVENIFIGSCTNRSEEHTSELQSLMRISYAVFCLKKKKKISKCPKTDHTQSSLLLQSHNTQRPRINSNLPNAPRNIPTAAN